MVSIVALGCAANDSTNTPSARYDQSRIERVLPDKLESKHDVQEGSPNLIEPGASQAESHAGGWRVYVEDNNVFVSNGRGDVQQLTFKGRDSRPLLSHCKERVYFVRESGRSQELAIMQIDIKEMREQKLADEVYHVDWKETSRFSAIYRLSLSPDGRFLFFVIPKWAVSDSLLRLDLKTKKVKEISHADSFEIIQKGRLKGKLIVLRSEIRGDEGRTWSYWLLDEDGNSIEEICDEDDEETLKSFRLKHFGT